MAITQQHPTRPAADGPARPSTTTEAGSALPAVIPLMGPPDPVTVTPVMGPADPGTVTPLMGPADPGTVTLVIAPPTLVGDPLHRPSAR